MASAKDVIIVQQNWLLVSDDLMGFGVEVFSGLLKANDQYIQRFEGIGVSGGLDVANPKMREHGLRIMSTLGSWIHTLSDFPVVSELLKRQGTEHKDRNIGEDEFKLIQPYLLNALERRVGAKFNRTAWTNIWAYIIQGLAQGWK